MSKPIMCPAELLALPLHGKVIIITSGNSGIGFATAQQVAKQGATVILACRNQRQGNKAAASILKNAPEATVKHMQLDLADLSSVRSFARAFLQQYSHLSVLVNNAGVMNTEKQTTKDGFDIQFGTNYLGHFLLTELLLPALTRSAPSRIINISSCYHDQAHSHEGRIHFSDLHFEKTAYNGWQAYAQSKLANVLHAKELARKLEGTGVVAVSLHPGAARTKITRYTVPLWIQNYLARPILKYMGIYEPWIGCQTTLYTILSPDIEQHSGAYFSQVGVYRNKSANDGGWPLKSPNPVANDMSVARRLWEVSWKMVGLHSSSIGV